MNNFGLNFWLLVLSTFLTILLVFYILKQKEKKQLHKIFLANLTCTLIISLGVLLQNILSYFYHIPEIWFENIIYIGTCFLPVSIFFTSLIFVQTKIKFKKKYLLLFFIPIVSLLILWTNDKHHLFYVTYSYSFTETIYGPYFYVHTIYSYLLLFIGIVRLLIFSIKNLGIFSKQSILICIGMVCPITVNILGSFLKIMPLTVYDTPISFSISIICFSLAIFKFNFLGVAPIAIQKIVDRISDSYVVLNDSNSIADFNKTFLITFNFKDTETRKQNIIELFTKKQIDFDYEKLNDIIDKVKNSEKTFSFEQDVKKLHRTFSVEISTIYSEQTSLGTLILFKDITQHKKDVQTIKDNQNLLIERERLASLGQLIGGIAHNLKTPIMSISGASEGIKDLVNEFDASIGNPIVTNDDFHDIAKDMREWLDKINSYTEYMSDILTAVKGQAVALSEQADVDFTLGELFKRVDILMKHELKQSVTYLNMKMKVDENTIINGDVNTLVQVVNNMISNSIQAYNGKPEQQIDLIAWKNNNNNIVITVKDYGPGLPEKVKQKLFKEMITTKGKNGTGLGLYMSYSTIRAHFNGDITVETEDGKGTTFNIILP